MKKFILMAVYLLIFSSVAVAYESASSTPVHQYIANESRHVWKLMPYEMEDYFKHGIYDSLDVWGYDSSEGIIIGSGEEDTARCLIPTSPDCPYYRHFWEPDNPRGGRYSDGLNFPWEFDSSYERALEYWQNYVIPYYTKGDLDRSYYWLGRVVHLIEDAATPAHMHNDPHPVVKSLENYTQFNFQNWNGTDYEGDQYNYEDLPNMDGFDWSQVDARDEQNPELFRLFWYTAQKTQYYASDDADGNSVYYDLDDQVQAFSTSLWNGEGITIISDQNEVSDNISTIANASLSHAMKATAGLYRLFWDTVHSYDWPTFHHDNRRTGFTLLKGDMAKRSDVQTVNLVLQGGVTQDIESRNSIADLDGNGRLEIVAGLSKQEGGDDGWVFAVERIPFTRSTFYQKWKYDVGYPVEAPPSLDNIDSGSKKEVVVGLENGTLIVLDVSFSGWDASHKWDYSVSERYSAIGAGNYRGRLRYTAIADIDLDGKKEIIFSDGRQALPDWPGAIHVLEDNGASASDEYNYTLYNGGGEGPPSIANVDDDDYPEIVVPSYYGVYVFDYNDTYSNLTKKWNNTDGKIFGAVVLHDIDRDNEYELIYVSQDRKCHATKTCYNRLYIRDAKTGSHETGSPVSLSFVPKGTPAVGDVDNDGDAEIVFVSRDSVSSSFGGVHCYERGGSICAGSWPFTNGGTLKTRAISPDIVDIDGDGEYDIVVVEANSSRIFILNGDGTEKFNFSYAGEIASAPAIGDLDGDGRAEIAVKRLGSPISIMSSTTGFNNQPEITKSVINITGIAGDMISINSSGVISALDLDNDDLNFSYSAPFNASGYWNTTVNDTGNYSIFVTVDDGNLTDYVEVSMMVFNSTTQVKKVFIDGNSSQLLNFSGAGSISVNITLPKNALIQYSRLRVRGDSR